MDESATNWAPPRLTYGITPLKASFTEERKREVAALQSARIRQLPVDALVVYDLQDESSRTDAERPFPFLESIDPLAYAYDYLAEVDLPKVVYRSVAGQTEAALTAWLTQLAAQRAATVLVGAPSKHQAVHLKLRDAYRIRQEVTPGLPIGGVLIAERHETGGDEVARIVEKRAKGCEFFVTQAVYSVTASKNVLSDLYYRCEAEQRPTPHVLVTISPCGSQKTLEFMRWLGIAVPRWLENELLHSHDILEKSVDLTVAAFEELHQFASEKGISLGCNVESVSTRRAEIDASVEMVKRVAGILRAPGR